MIRLDRLASARVALLFVAFIVPLCGAAGILIAQQTGRIALTERERVGTLLTTRTIAVVRSLRNVRDRMVFDRDPAPSERHAAAQALALLEVSADQSSRIPGLAERVQRLVAEWREVPAGSGGGAAVSKALATASSIFAILNRGSALDADPDAAIAMLFDAYGVALPAVSERVDRAALTLVGSGGSQSSRGADRFGAAVLAGQAGSAYDTARSDLTDAAKAGFESPALDERIAAIGPHLASLIRISRSARFDRTDLAATMASVRGSESAIAASTADADADLDAILHSLLAARAADERFSLLLMRAEAALALIVGAWIALLLARTIRDRDRREIERARSEAGRLLAELDLQRAHEELALTEAQFRAAFDRSSIGVAILASDGTIMHRNRALADVLETLDERQIGAGHPDFTRLLAGEIESFAAEVESRSDDGALAWEVTLSLVRDDGGAPRFAISMVKDVTERKRTDDRLRYDASHDALSGLPNRSFFCERLDATFFGGRTPAGVSAVLFVDLDEFKFVNDSLGHAVGDRVLVETGERLRASTTNTDCIARFGGDEFAVFLGGRHTLGEIEAVVKRLVQLLAEPLGVDGREVFVTASIGVAIVHSAYRTVEEILRDADTAMYYAKSAGRARSAVFDGSMHDHASRRLEIATHLGRALEDDQFYLVYQPVVSLVTGAIVSCEVLLRWENPVVGLVPPGEFIPIAEELGIIVPLGRYVLDRACRQFAQWRRDDALRPASISVNASVREIVQTDFVEQVEAAIARYAMRPGELILEVTETAILSSAKFSNATLDRLKAAGVALAIDDFGTGYSSLRYLQQFPFDELKIDRSFVAGADGRLASEPIVTMLLTLAKSCGVGVVAEGVETFAQATRLRALGCARAQGDLYGRPCRAEDLPALFGREANFAS
jgi:diguanylate cyclase (GGDEF)-like protein/PAS domain S-box-containing protein